MPSPADRRRLEGGLRLMASAALGALLWLAWRPAAATPLVSVAGDTRALPAALAGATRQATSRLDLNLDSLPGAAERGWARALASAGTQVQWRLAAGVHPRVTATVEPIPDPSGRVRVVATGAPGAPLTVRDAAGIVDSTTLSAAGVRLVDATVDGVVRVVSPGGMATAARRDSVVVRPVLVLARAGWEGKFVVAALEEAGWEVDARFHVAPQVAVRQGDDAPIDTARFAAVVALDSSAAPFAAAIGRFVRSGGGVVMTAEAARSAPLAAIAPARPGEPVTPLLGAVTSVTPRRALGGVSLVALQPAAVVLERTGTVPRLAAGRVDLGRALLLGYTDTWRWRMEGGDGAPAAHRAWWSALVASVAYAPLVQLAEPPPTDEAPSAALVDALGAPAPGAPTGSPPVSRAAWEGILFALLIGALLAEWGSRRLRGER